VVSIARFEVIAAVLLALNSLGYNVMLLWHPSSRVQTRTKPSDFSGEKILSTPSFGGEVKQSVQCRKFTVCKRTQKWRGSRHSRQNSRKFLARSSTFRCWGSLASF